MKKPAIFAAIILIALVFMNLLNFSIFRYANDDGWYVTDKSVTTFMQDGEVRTVELTYMDALEPIYERLGSLFVTEEKLELDTSYPTFVGQEANALFFSDDTMALVTNTFGSLPTYNGLYLSAGTTYNTDGTRADGDEFILTYMPGNGLYLAAQNIVVNTVYGEKIIPMNSVVDFSSDSILYMAFNDGMLQGDKISAMNQASITIGTTTYDYYNFLIQLGILEEKIEKQGNQEVSEDEVSAWEQFLKEQKEREAAEAAEAGEAEGTALESETMDGSLSGEGEDWNAEDQWETEDLDESDEDDDWYAEDQWVYSSDTEDKDVDLSTDSDAEEDMDGDEPVDEEPQEDMESDESGDSGGFNWGSDSGWGSSDGDDFSWGSDSSSGSGNSTADPSDPVYTMPTVALGDDVTTWVYTVDGSITIDDPSYRMSGGVTICLYNDEDQLVMRKVVYSTGDFQLSGVEPNMTYTLKGTYYYYDNSNVKQSGEVVYEGTVQTLDTDSLIAFTPWLDASVTARESELYPEKIVIHDLQFVEAVVAAEEAAAEEEAAKQEEADGADETDETDETGGADETDDAVVASVSAVATLAADDTTEDDTTDEPYVYSALDTIKFVGRASITITKAGATTSTTSALSSNQLSNMRNGEIIDFTSGMIFDSNSTYTYKITYYDSYSNEMPLTSGTFVTGVDGTDVLDEYGNEKETVVSGTARTCKETPTAAIYTGSLAVASVTLTVQIKNDDLATMEGVVLRVLDSSGNVVSVTGTNAGTTTSQQDWVIGDGDGVAGSYSMVMTSLNTAEAYTVQVYCDSYDIDDNNTYENQIITSVTFYTRSLATLGYVDFATTFSDYSSSGVTATSNMYSTVNTTLKTLLTRAEVEIEKDDTVYAKVSFSKEDLDDLKDELTEVNSEKAPTYDAETGLWWLELPTTDTYYEDNGEYSQADATIYLTATTEATLLDPWAAFLASSNADSSSPSVVTIVDGLDSNTQYNFAVNAYAQQGSNPEEDVSSLSKWQSFTTWKEEASTYIGNQFTSGNFHEIFDFGVIDKDGAIANNQNGGVTLAIFKNGTIVQSTTINAETEYDSYRFANLEEGVEYTLVFIAQEYNTGAGREYSYYIQPTYTFTTGTGITGEISLNAVDKIYRVNDTDKDITWADLNIWPDVVSTCEKIEYSLLGSNGVAAAYSSSNYVTFTGIEVTAGAEYIYSAGDGYTFRRAFYDENGAFISGSYYSDGNSYGGTFTVPDDAVTMSVSTHSSSRFYIHGVLMEYNSTLSASSPNIYTDETADAAIENYYLNANGTAYTSTEEDIYVTDYIPVDKGGLYVLDGFGTSTINNTVVYYDTYKNFVKYQYAQGNELLVVPENATYLRMENYTTYPDTTIKKYATMSATYLSGKLDVHVLDQLDILKEYMDGNPYYTVQLSYVELEDAENDDMYTPYLDSDGNPVVINGPIDEEFTYSEPNEDGGYDTYREVWDTIAFGTLNKDYAWKAELILSIFGSEILLDEVKFTTEASVKTISNQEELQAIALDPSANYVVIQDFTTTGQAYTSTFSGTLDLQGHTITYANQWYYPLFETVNIAGVIKNGTIDYDSYAGSYYNSYNGAALVRYNYGTVENIMLNISVDYGDYPFAGYRSAGLAYNNYATGVIQNFAVYYETEMKVSEGFGGVTQYNIGLIQNGWVGGEAFHSVNYTMSEGENYYSLNYDTANNIGGIVRENDGTVRNIYTLNDIYYDEGTYNNEGYDPGLLVWYNSGSLDDCYAGGDVYMYNPNTSNIKTYEEVSQLVRKYAGGYDVSEVWQVERSVPLTANNAYEKVANAEIVYDIYWQDSVINGDDQFKISDLISTGYYPHVEMGSYMETKQVYVPLPDASASTLDIISTLMVSQTYEKGEAIITVENPNNATVTAFEIDGIETVTITSQGLEEDKYRVYVTLEDPTKFVSSYEITQLTSVSSTGVTNHTTFGDNTSRGMKVVYAEFFRPISNVDEWNEYVTVFSAGENFHLTADIDFSEDVQSFDNDVFVNNNFTGKLDGGVYNQYGYLTHMYTLKNINNYSNTNGAVFYQVSGTIRNVIVENYTAGYGSYGTGANLSYVGFIRYLNTGGTVENVHVIDSTLAGAEYIGGVVAYANYGYMEYCSSSNLTIEYIKDTGAETLEAGGIVGRNNAAILQSCYAQDFYMKTDYVESCGGVGGIAGTAPSGDGGFISCWSSGDIDILAKNLGGIVGRQKESGGYVRNCWSMVNISTVGDGIAGLVGTGYAAISNSIALGDLVSRSTEVTALNRLGQGTITNGYAYELQLLNGVVSTDLNGAINLMSISDLSNLTTWNSQIQIGSNYSVKGSAEILMGDYGAETPSVVNGYLPMLVYEDGRGVYGQEPIQLVVAELDIEVMSTTKVDENWNFELYLNITSEKALNVAYYTATMEGATIDEQYDYPYSDGSDNTRQLQIFGDLTNAWDSYLVTAYAYDENDNVIGYLTEKITFDSPIYKDIPSASMWYTYLSDGRQNTFENLKITGDLDFSPASLSKVFGVSLNRLEGFNGTGTTEEMRNFGGTASGDLTYTASASDARFSLIQTVISSVENINFQYIEMDTSATSDSAKTGLIGSTYGTINNVNFNNLDLHFSSGDVVGTIGYMASVVTDVTLENINITSEGGSYVGGFAGYLDETSSQLVRVKMLGSRTLNSGGDEDDPEDYTYSNNIISNASSGSYYGGLFGYMTTQTASWSRDFEYMEVHGTYVNGRSYVGGICGLQHHYMDFWYTTVTDSYIHGERINNSSGGYYVGGISGYLGHMYNYYPTVTNTHVVADAYYAGAITGQNHNYERIAYGLSSGNFVSAGIAYAGGLTGYYGEMYDNIVENCTISVGFNTYYSGNSDYNGYAGGLTGHSPYTCRDNAVVSTSVSGGQYIGGIAGSLTTDSYDRNYSNTVVSSTITGEEQVGGLYGETIASVFGGTVLDSTITGDINVGGAIGRAYATDMYAMGVNEGTTVTGDTNVGGLIGYTVYYTTKTADYLVNLTDSYSAATVRGDEYVGGLIGLYEPGASYTEGWPTYGDSGTNIGTPTSHFPVSYSGLLFMGEVSGNGNYTSLWGNGVEKADETGLNASRIYENAKIGTQLASAYATSSEALATETTTSTAAGLSIATGQQLNKQSFYEDEIADGGMNWDMTGTAGHFMGGTVSTLYGNDISVYRTGTSNDISVATSEATLNGTYNVTFSSGGADLADEYVQEDLVLWLDAKNSQGFGSRIEAETLAKSGDIWVNLASSGASYNGTINTEGGTSGSATTGYTWTEDGLYTDYPNYSQNYVTIPDLTSLMTNSIVDGYGEYTVQFVYKNDYSSGNYYGGLLCETADTSDALAYGRGTNKHIFYAGDSNNVEVYAENDEYMVTFIADYTGSSTQLKKIYVDGEPYPSWTGTSSTAAQFLQGELKWGKSSWTTDTNQTLSAIRIYNRVLTSDELAQNAIADAALYGPNAVGSYNGNVTVAATFENGVATISQADYEAAFGTVDAEGNAITPETLEGYVNVTISNTDANGGTSVLSQSIFVEEVSPSLTLTDGNNTEIANLATYTETPYVTVDGGTAPYTWYRSTTPNTAGGTLVETMDAEEARYLDGRGYYYCVDSTGKYSPLVFVNTQNYMFYNVIYTTTDGVFNAVGSEGLNTRTTGDEYAYDVYDHTDKWYTGGTKLPLPTIEYPETATAAVASLMMLSMDVELPAPPEATIYPSSEKTLNIEFDSTIPYNSDAEYAATSYFQIYAGDVLVDESYVENRVYTMEYDFVTDLTIVVSNGDETLDLTYEVEATEMQRSVMTYGDDYYYISPDGVSYSTGFWAGQFVHLMNGYGITSTGGVYDVATGYIVSSVKSVATILEDVTPMFSGNSNGLDITSFATFSEYGGTVFEKTEYVIKGDYVYTIPVDGSIAHDGFVVDSYGSNKYYGLLSASGVFSDVEGTIVIPEDISTSGIDHMTNTIGSDTHYVLIRYNSNKVAGFDYVTGELLDLTQPDDIEYGIVDFFNDNISTFGVTTSMSFASSYVAAVELQDAIETDDSLAQILNDGTIYEGDGFDDESVSGLGDEEIITEDTEADGEVDGVTDVVGEGIVVADEDFVDGDGTEDGDGESTDVDGETVDGDGNANGDGTTTVASASSASGDSDSDQESKESGQTSKEDSTDGADALSDGAGDATDATETTAKVGTTEADRQSSADSAQRYIVAYNTETGSYELYRTADLTADATDVVVSETQKVVELQKAGVLPEFTLGTVAQGQQTQDTGVNIFVIVVVAIGGLVVFLVVRFTMGRVKRRRKKTFASRIGRDE